MPSVRAVKKHSSRVWRSAACFALVALMCLTFLPLTAKADDTGEVTATNVNVRVGAGTNYSVAGRVDYKDTLTILGSEGDWYKIQCGSLTGYIYKDYVTVTTDTTSQSYSTLREGDTGSSVKAMQEKLIELGYLSGQADGEFGPLTLEAVKLYQSRKGLSVDGAAGNATLKTLYKDTTKYNDTFSKLCIGAKGSEVKALQQKLIQLKYLSGNADGVYGNKTLTAVKLYQKTRGLEVDGIAGPATQKALFADSEPYTASTTVTVSAGSLANGSTGDEVKKLQSALIYLGYLSGGADGKFGDKTEAAVRLYQKTNGMTVDGIAGSATIKKINAEKQLCENIVSTVKAQLGIPYVYGGSSRSGFDCSGLTMYVYGKYGIKMGHSSGIQSRIGNSVPYSQIRPGDLVGFYSPCGHVGIYIGGGNFIHAPQTGELVKITALANRNNLTCIRRFTGAVPNLG